MNLGKSTLGENYCTAEYACDKRRVDSFKIDWTHCNSIHNWMADLNLICEEPYKIGMIGSVSFISFSLGSLVTTQIADKGRRNIVIISSAVTPLGLLFLLKPLNLVAINILMVIIGFTYNAGSSIAYLMNTEFVEVKYRIKIGVITFGFCGVIQSLSGVWFY